MSERFQTLLLVPRLYERRDTWIQVALTEQPDPEAETIAGIVADAHHRFQRLLDASVVILT